MKFNEDSRLKTPTILHLIRLGYGYIDKSKRIINLVSKEYMNEHYGRTA